MKSDPQTLQAALAGYQSELQRIDQAMAEIRRELGISAGRKKTGMQTIAAPARKRRLSAAGRKRIAEATKKRWAAFRAQKQAAARKASR